MLSNRLTQIFYFFSALLLLQTDGVSAATQTMTARVAFASVLTISSVSDLSFGDVAADSSGTYTLSPSGSLVTSDGGVALGGDVHAGTMTISGSQTQSINIVATNYATSQGVTPSDATCSYSGGPVGSCTMSGLAAPGTGSTLLVGAKLVADGTQTAGTQATPTFDIVVTYQ